MLALLANLSVIENWTSFDNWDPEIAATGGGNAEFQQYYLHPDTAQLINNTLQMKPKFVETDLRQDLDLYNYGCTSNWNSGCFKSGSMHWNKGELHYHDGRAIPVGGMRSKPFRSTKLISKQDFGYGVIEVDFQLPRGNFLWPAIWMLPSTKLPWPYGGEIDLMESMGNEVNSGFAMDHTTVSAALHYGKEYSLYSTAFSEFAEKVQDEKFNRKNLDDGWHKVKLNRTQDNLVISVDDNEMLNCDKMFRAAAEKQPHDSQYRNEVLENGYKAGFGKYSQMMGHYYPDYLWKDMPYNAPFHGKFKLIVNLAIGGNFFQDNMNSGVNCVKTPWDDIEKGKLPSVSFLENMPKWFNWGDTPYKYEDYVENVCTLPWQECIKDHVPCNVNQDCYLEDEKHLAYKKPSISDKTTFHIGKIKFSELA